MIVEHAMKWDGLDMEKMSFLKNMCVPTPARNPGSNCVSLSLVTVLNTDLIVKCVNIFLSVTEKSSSI